jgi:hypothetical protein
VAFGVTLIRSEDAPLAERVLTVITGEAVTINSIGMNGIGVPLIRVSGELVNEGHLVGVVIEDGGEAGVS